MAPTSNTICDLAVGDLMKQFRRASGFLPGSKLSRTEIAKLTPMGAVLANKAFATQAAVQILTVSVKEPKLSAREYRDAATSYFQDQVLAKVVDLGGPSSQVGDGVITAEELELASPRVKKFIAPVERENALLAIRLLQGAFAKSQAL